MLVYFQQVSKSGNWKLFSYLTLKDIEIIISLPGTFLQEYFKTFTTDGSSLFPKRHLEKLAYYPVFLAKNLKQLQSGEEIDQMITLEENIKTFPFFRKLCCKSRRKPADWLFARSPSDSEKKPVKIIINTVKCN